MEASDLLATPSVHSHSIDTYNITSFVAKFSIQVAVSVEHTCWFKSELW